MSKINLNRAYMSSHMTRYAPYAEDCDISLVQGNPYYSNIYQVYGYGESSIDIVTKRNKKYYARRGIPVPTDGAKIVDGCTSADSVALLLNDGVVLIGVLQADCRWDEFFSNAIRVKIETVSAEKSYNGMELQNGELRIGMGEVLHMFKVGDNEAVLIGKGDAIGYKFIRNLSYFRQVIDDEASGDESANYDYEEQYCDDDFAYAHCNHAGSDECGDDSGSSESDDADDADDDAADAADDDDSDDDDSDSDESDDEYDNEPYHDVNIYVDRNSNAPTMVHYIHNDFGSRSIEKLTQYPTCAMYDLSQFKTYTLDDFNPTNAKEVGLKENMVPYYQFAIVCVKIASRDTVDIYFAKSRGELLVVRDILVPVQESSIAGIACYHNGVCVSLSNGHVILRNLFGNGEWGEFFQSSKRVNLGIVDSNGEYDGMFVNGGKIEVLYGTHLYIFLRGFHKVMLAVSIDGVNEYDGRFTSKEGYISKDLGRAPERDVWMFIGKLSNEELFETM